MTGLKAALYSTLNHATLLAVAPGGVHDMLAPAGTAAPYVVFQVLGSEVDRTLRSRVSEAFEVQVRVVAEGPDSTPIESAKAVILGLLDGANLSVSGHETWVCQSTGEIPDYAEMAPDGRALLHGGLRFRIILA